MNLFKNPELRRSTRIIVISNIIMLCILLLVFNYGYNEIKKGYIEDKANVVARISENYPEESSEIISSFLKPSKSESDVNKGLEIMEKYGYSGDMEIKYVGGIYNSYKPVIFIIVLVGIAFMLIQIILTYYYHKYTYRKLNKLAVASNEILRSNYDIEIEEYEEGEFSEITHGFSEMRDVIKNQMNIINDEKKFLVNLLSDISHQLKTPLASSMLFIDILTNRNLKEEDKTKFLNKTKIQLERIEWLIKSLLKLSKIDARAIKFNMDKNNLNLILNEAIRDLEALAQINNAKIEYKENKEIDIVCDKDWIKEAIINIAKNAIEHSKDGKVIISTEKSIIYTKITIKDTGEGISSEVLPNIFTRFYKGSKPDSVGIGLSLSKSIVEAHNGSIKVNSELGEGSEFTILLNNI